MDLKQYQEWTITTSIYPGAGEHGFNEALYLTLGLTSEAGEVAGKVKKIIRGDTVEPESLVSEMSDVLWYLTRMCDNLGFNLEDLADYNYKKLEARKNANALQGNGETIESRTAINHS